MLGMAESNIPVKSPMQDREAGSQTPFVLAKCDPVSMAPKPAVSAGLRESRAGSRGVTCVILFAHDSASVPKPAPAAFACLSRPLRLPAPPFDRAAARVESALSSTASSEQAIPPPSPAFFRPHPPRFERTLAAAFGLAGSSAIKTGGYNRLAGKTN